MSSRMTFSMPATALESDQRRKKFSPAWIEPSAIAARPSGTSSDLMPRTTTVSMTDFVMSGIAISALTARIAARIIRNRPR